MKTYKNLYLNFISDENIKLAVKNFSKGKKKRNKVKKILDNPDYWIPKIRDYVINYKPYYHEPKCIYDGISRKKREIVIPSVMESIMHHMVVNTLKPMFTKGMYEHSYGSVPGRGNVYGKKCICKWILKGDKNIKYCYKLDIRHFYASIPQDKLIEMLKAKIHDFKFMRILENIIRTVPKGLPLGFYTSVWLANWYIDSLDHTIKSCGTVTRYARFVDDMVIFSSNKKKLHKIKTMIDDKLRSLELTVKDNWQIFRFDYIPKRPKISPNGKTGIYGRAVDFMGFKFYRNRTTLRKSILHKMKKKAMKLWKKERVTLFDAKQMLSSLSWIKHSDIYNYYTKHIKPFVAFKKLKQKVSNADRKAGKYDRLQTC